MLGGVTKGQHFGVGCGVVGSFALVMAGSDDDAVVNDYCANGNIAALGCKARLFEVYLRAWSLAEEKMMTKTLAFSRILARILPMVTSKLVTPSTLPLRLCSKPAISFA